MAEVAVDVEGLGKRYRIGGANAAYQTLRESFESRVRSIGATTSQTSDLWALRDLTFSVEPGEIVGIIGRNGGGKTTLLKAIAQIIRPTTGVIRTRGLVGALLEVGTGFHPELTGGENIFLNGAILGMSRREIKRRFDEIASFAGVERFLDTPLKRYSTGMQLRLAFAVAAHVEPEIVVVDEVLAVGDADFQHKCLGKMSEFGREGRTVLFVSHDLGAIGQLCRRVIWLEGGRIRDDGSAHDVLERYLVTTTSHVARVELPLEPEKPVQLILLAVTDGDGSPLQRARRDLPLALSLSFVTRDRIPGLEASIYLLNRKGMLVLNENISDQGLNYTLSQGSSQHDLSLTIPPVLPAGDYVAGVWIGTETESFVHRELLDFSLLPRPDDRRDSLERGRLVQPPVRWSIESRPLDPQSVP